MFGRGKKKAPAAPTLLDATINEVVSIGLSGQPVSAREAFAAANDVLRRHTSDGRLYLVIGPEVGASGLADNWQFHYLFPELHAEGVVTVRTGAAASNRTAEVHSLLTPFPAPGTSEHAAATTGGIYMALIIEEKWQERLQRITGLPTSFRDSSDAVADLNELGQSLFHAGPVRLKGRTTPEGHAVWEAVTPNGVAHAPFA